MSIHDSLIGKKLGDYRIIDLLGQGGMARVYRGYDDNLQRYAAVKVFDSYAVTSEELEEYRERFQREARAIARLRHPYIVGIYQFGQIDSINYMAMAFIEGRDLRYILREHAEHGSYMPHADIMRIMTDVASALDYAHREGVIHRDVKPSNIMVMADGHAILTDFGLALNMREGTIGTTFGSVHYIAPEQAVSSAQSVPQSDLYSLGVVLYEMLTGKVPFDDASAMSVALRHLSDPPPPLRRFNPAVSAEVEAMVLHALDKEPQKRFQTGSAFIRAFELALGLTDEDEMTRHLAPQPGWATASDQSTPGKKPTSLPVISGPDERTVSDVSARARPPLPAAPAPRRRLPLWNLLVLAGLVLMIAGGVLVISAISPQEGDLTPTAPRLAGVGSPTPDGATAAVVNVPETAEATAEATSPPTETPTPTPTPAPPTSTPTASPTATSEPVDVRLIYDARTLVLLNTSDAAVDVSNMLFVQRTETGGEITFRSSNWGGGSVPPSRLPPGDCFQIWSFDDSFIEQPEYCNTRHSWRQTSPIRLFWVSEVEEARFSVLRNGVELAQCNIAAGECTFALNADE